MLFNSFHFLWFLPIVFSIHWMLPAKWRWIILLLSSYYFYMSWNVEYILLILGTTAVSYIFALLISRTASLRAKKRYLALTVLICIGVLFFFKYFNFVSESIVELCRQFALPVHPVTLNLLLPVGISFYTFQTLAYVIDVYRGTVAAETHFGKYATFISFFPQLVAGPIERTSNLLPQITTPQVFSYHDATYGLKLMAWGFFKKVAVADYLAQYVDSVYNSLSSHTGFSLIVATVLFAIQIYCDFSGYSDIAIGTAKLFGIDLMQNFKSPYFAASIKEFWARWHISLSQWFRDYVYIPLGGNRCSKVRHRLNLIVTFLVSGLWHGANWTFVIWGLLHGLGQVIEGFLAPHQKTANSPIVRAVKTCFVFLFVVGAWVFFRASSLEDAVYVFCHAFDGITAPLSYIDQGLNGTGIWFSTLFSQLLPMIGTLAVFDYFNQKTDVIQWIGERPPVIRWGFYVALFFAIIFLRPVNSGSEFIYFQF